MPVVPEGMVSVPAVVGVGTMTGTTSSSRAGAAATMLVVCGRREAGAPPSRGGQPAEVLEGVAEMRHVDEAPCLGACPHAVCMHLRQAAASGGTA